MSDRLRNAVWALGAAQCVLWGMLFYSFTVLIVPLQRELALSRVELAGAFSLGLLVMALAAPAVGQRVDRNHGPATMRLGIGIACIGLVALSRATSAGTLYLAWLALGVAMAACLYEPAFGLVTRAIDEPRMRLRALSSVTVAGGLASTIFLPLLALLISAAGWRPTLLISAMAVLLAGLLLELLVFPALQPTAWFAARHGVAMRNPPRPPHFLSLSAIFVAATVSSMALTILLVPLLVDRGIAATAAAAVLAAFGISQLPGRLWMLRASSASPRALLVTAPLLLQGCGLVLVAIQGPLSLAMLGVVVFGAGAGLHTLARPWLIIQLFGADHAGVFNGRIARHQGLARAAGPLLAAAAAAVVPAPKIFLALGIGLLLMVPIATSLRRAAALP